MGSKEGAGFCRPSSFSKLDKLSKESPGVLLYWSYLHEEPST